MAMKLSVNWINGRYWQQKKVPYIHCCGDCEHAVKKADTAVSRHAAVQKCCMEGEMACTYGCLGKGDCAAICPYDAIYMEKGIAQTSMDDIAKAAGYSKATLYVYFENKRGNRTVF